MMADIQEHIELPCGKCLCVRCFSQSVAEAGCNNYIECSCSGCKTEENQTASFTVYSVDLKQQRNDRSRLAVKKSITNFEFELPDETDDPVRHYEHYIQSTGNADFFSLSLTTSHYDKDETFNIDTDTGLFNINRSSEWGDDLTGIVEKVFKFCHACLITNDAANTKIEYNPFSYPTAESINDIIGNDKSPLHRCLFALSFFLFASVNLFYCIASCEATSNDPFFASCGFSSPQRASILLMRYFCNSSVPVRIHVLVLLRF